ncbi:hypothetical protein Avbf_09278 [Armadillidium vulgare]|nr:hypothetical protein Avbf_09278 [Armadillidium vulgare]
MERQRRGRRGAENPEEGGQPDADTVCGICERDFASHRGMRVHYRHAHPEQFHAGELAARGLVKERWTSSEVAALMNHEAKLIIDGLTDGINQRLAALHPSRTLEAIKSRRMRGSYRDGVASRVDTLLARENPPQAPPPIQHPADDRPLDLPGALPDEVVPEVRVDWREAMSAAVDSLFFEANGVEGSTPVHLNAGDDVHNNTETLLNAVLAEAGVVPRRAENIAQPPTRPPREGNPPPLGARNLRQWKWEKVQRLWQTSRGRAADVVLNDRIIQQDAIPEEDKTRYWREIFGTESVPDDRRSGEINSNHLLAEPVNTAEVTWALRGMADTSPGTDGVKLNSIKKVREALLAALFNQIWMTGDLPPSMKGARTLLIPKSASPEGPGEFRPITITSVLTRCFHRILADRCSRGTTISPRQRGFVKADGCAENIVVLSSLLSNAQQERKGSLYGAFIDLRKAFDSVSHNSIARCLLRVGVPEQLVGYIIAQYAHATTTLNGEQLPINRGVRQGDPLSPFVFNCLLDSVLAEIPEGLGVPLGDGEVSHLAFADDVVLLSSSRSGLQAILEHYLGGVSLIGLHPGMNKCSSFAIVVDGKRKRWLWDKTPFAVGGQPMPALSCRETYRYLGTEIGMRKQGFAEAHANFARSWPVGEA